MYNDRGKWLVVTSTCPFTLQVMGRGPWLVAVIACKTRFTLVNDPDNYIRMTYVDHPDVLCMAVRMLCLWVSFDLPWGGPDMKGTSRDSVYPDEDDPDEDACHVSPWGVRHVFSRGGVPTHSIGKLGEAEDCIEWSFRSK